MEIMLLNDPFIISNMSIMKHDTLPNIYHLSDGYIYTRDKDAVYKSSYDSKSIFIIGYVLDIRDGDLTRKSIVENLLSRNFNTDMFLDELDYLSGRYIIIIDDGNQSTLYTDATGLRPVFYWENKIYGSHEVLVKEIVNANFEADITKFKKKMNGYLDYSNSESIYKINPNLSYNLSLEKPTRIYPRKIYQIKNSNDVLSSIIPGFEEEIKWLKNQNRHLYLSLTGGSDSRVTMALTKDIQEQIRYFTYMKNTENGTLRMKRIYNMDKRIVDKLKYNLNLNHHYIYFDNIEISQTSINKLSNHTTSSHAYKLGIVLGDKLEKNSFHIRSTLYELGKIPYNTDYENSKSIEEMFEVSLPWKPNNIINEEGKKFYNAYLKRNKLNKILELNYHLPLMHYWETRMGNWHSNLTQETDLHHETFIIINNRFMLDKLISLNYKERSESTLFTKLIKHNWPILNYFIPNTNLTLEDENLKKYETTNFNLNYSGIHITHLENLNLYFNKNEYQLLPLMGTHLKDDNHIFEFKNINRNKINVTITTYYSRVRNQISIIINDVEKDIADLTTPEFISLESGEKISIKYQYKNNHDAESWYNAGKLSITF